MTVTITSSEGGRVREVGRLLWDGVRIVVDPARESDRPLLMRILADPIVIDEDGHPVEVSATAEPRKFLKNLFREYNGSYLRASKPE